MRISKVTLPLNAPFGLSDSLGDTVILSATEVLLVHQALTNKRSGKWRLWLVTGYETPQWVDLHIDYPRLGGSFYVTRIYDEPQENGDQSIVIMITPPDLKLFDYLIHNAYVKMNGDTIYSFNQID